MASAGSAPATTQASTPKTWPELVGEPAQAAKKKLESEDPSLNVEIIPYDELRKAAPDTANTVRLWLDAEGNVYIVPTLEQPVTTATATATTQASSAITAWPDLVGVDGEEAKELLESEDPSLNVEMVFYGDLEPQLPDKANTVRLWLDVNGDVYIVPKLEQPQTS